MGRPPNGLYCVSPAYSCIPMHDLKWGCGCGHRVAGALFQCSLGNTGSVRWLVTDSVVLCCTLQDKLKVTWDTSGWKEVYPTDIPQQQNGFDCGVFALMFCNRMGLKGGAFDFRQQDISVNVRVAITCDLLDGAIKATARKT